MPSFLSPLNHHGILLTMMCGTRLSYSKNYHWQSSQNTFNRHIQPSYISSEFNIKRMVNNELQIIVSSLQLNNLGSNSNILLELI